MKIYNFENVEYALGQTSQENWVMLTVENPKHYFFHLSSFPSGYCSLRHLNPTDEMIRTAANFCKQGSKHKNAKNLYVDYCKFSNLIKGEKEGEVIFKSNRQVDRIKT